MSTSNAFAADSSGGGGLAGAGTSSGADEQQQQNRRGSVGAARPEGTLPRTGSFDSGDQMLMNNADSAGVRMHQPPSPGSTPPRPRAYSATSGGSNSPANSTDAVPGLRNGNNNSGGKPPGLNSLRRGSGSSGGVNAVFANSSTNLFRNGSGANLLNNTAAFTQQSNGRNGSGSGSGVATGNANILATMYASGTASPVTPGKNADLLESAAAIESATGGCCSSAEGFAAAFFDDVVGSDRVAVRIVAPLLFGVAYPLAALGSAMNSPTAFVALLLGTAANANQAASAEVNITLSTVARVVLALSLALFALWLAVSLVLCCSCADVNTPTFSRAASLSLVLTTCLVLVLHVFQLYAAGIDKNSVMPATGYFVLTVALLLHGVVAANARSRDTHCTDCDSSAADASRGSGSPSASRIRDDGSTRSPSLSPLFSWVHAPLTFAALVLASVKWILTDLVADFVVAIIFSSAVVLVIVAATRAQMRARRDAFVAKHVVMALCSYDTATARLVLASARGSDVAMEQLLARDPDAVEAGDDEMLPVPKGIVPSPASSGRHDRAFLSGSKNAADFVAAAADGSVSSQHERFIGDHTQAPPPENGSHSTPPPPPPRNAADKYAGQQGTSTAAGKHKKDGGAHQRHDIDEDAVRLLSQPTPQMALVLERAVANLDRVRPHIPEWAIHGSFGAGGRRGADGRDDDEESSIVISHSSRSGYAMQGMNRALSRTMSEGSISADLSGSANDALAVRSPSAGSGLPQRTGSSSSAFFDSAQQTVQGGGSTGDHDVSIVLLHFVVTDDAPTPDYSEHRMLERVFVVARQLHGVVHHFIGSTCVVSWNAVRRTPAPESKAARFLMTMKTFSGDAHVIVSGAAMTGRVRCHLAGTRHKSLVMSCTWWPVLEHLGAIARSRNAMMIDGTTKSAVFYEYVLRGYGAFELGEPGSVDLAAAGGSFIQSDTPKDSSRRPAGAGPAPLHEFDRSSSATDLADNDIDIPGSTHVTTEFPLPAAMQQQIQAAASLRRGSTVIDAAREQMLKRRNAAAVDMNHHIVQTFELLCERHQDNVEWLAIYQRERDGTSDTDHGAVDGDALSCVALELAANREYGAAKKVLQKVIAATDRGVTGDCVAACQALLDRLVAVGDGRTPTFAFPILW